MHSSTNYTDDDIKVYGDSLAKVGALSNLFSESTIPFIHYRATEYLYARSMNADNLSRSDIAIDAKRGEVGVGIKTFVYNNKPKYEKIAEFNKELSSYNKLDHLERVIQVAKLRNERLDFAGHLTGVSVFIYHCIARLPGKIIVFEQDMPYITVDSIAVTQVNGGTISFTDGLHKYRFNSSKSTLFKEFYSSNNIFEKSITIYEDPFTLLNTLDLDDQKIYTVPVSTLTTISPKETVAEDSIILPLYGRGGEVFQRSGLNQWNAGGRTRNPDEVYIPYPVEARNKKPNFLPSRKTPFDLHFPGGKIMQVKVSQADGKSLMSTRNSDLGKWLLRDVLQLKEGTLVTRELLDRIGIDSVEITKIDNKYYIDFKRIGSYEEFLES